MLRAVNRSGFRFNISAGRPENSARSLPRSDFGVSGQGSGFCAEDHGVLFWEPRAETHSSMMQKNAAGFSSGGRHGGGEAWWAVRVRAGIAKWSWSEGDELRASEGVSEKPAQKIAAKVIKVKEYVVLLIKVALACYRLR